ncbi:MAG: hypothetical protein ACR2FJ_03120 [Qipengyuania sp.]
MSLRSGIIAGLIAGLVFMILEMVLVATVGGGSAWGPPRMIGAIVLGREVLPPPATFDLGIFLVAMLIHFALSAVLGVLFAMVALKMRLSNTMMIVLGVVFGLLVYLINFYGFTALFPWFAMARNWISIFVHAVFGGVLGWWLTRGHIRTIG